MRGATPIADVLRMALAEVLRKAGVEQADFYARGYGVRVLAEELQAIGAEAMFVCTDVRSEDDVRNLVDAGR